MRNPSRILFALCFIGLVFSSNMALPAAHPKKVPQQPILAKSGGIKGVVNFCGAQGNNGTMLSLLGHSFNVLTDASGAFNFNYVPAGTYDMKIQVPGEVPVILSVKVKKKKITHLKSVDICPDNDGDGFTVDVDCNDNNPTVNPGASEECDGIDNNCDAEVDEGCTTCSDGDMDGFFAQAGCDTVEDCDDSDNTIFPNATEVCDGVDNDCDSEIDENFDGDNDTFTSCGGDCNDGNADINPNATEVCDQQDNNCDGMVDEGGICGCSEGEQEACYTGPEGTEGVGVCQAGISTCDANGQFGPCVGESLPFPTGELCNGQDDDCDGIIDNPSAIYRDCALPDSCIMPECSNGTCGNTPFPDGTLCDDGIPNTVGDSCLDGICVGNPAQ